MSLTKEAIQEIKITDQVKNVQKHIDNIDIEASLIAVPANVSVEDLEDKQMFRNSYRFKFNTTNISDFVDYSKEFQQEGAKCFIDADLITAKAIYDLGTEVEPLHQRHTAALALKKTSAYQALLKISGARLSQRDASNWLDDWADNIQVYASDESIITNHQASKRIREITIEQVANRESKVGDFGETRSAFEKVEAKNQETIPAYLHFTCQPYNGLSDRAFVLRLQILTGGDKPEISMRIIKLEAHQDDIAEEFKEKLTAMFKGTDIKTFIGS